MCSHETWSEIYARMVELIDAHRTTLVFVNTRKMAERVSAQLTKLVGEDVVTCHHGSLSKERRLDAEQRPLAGGGVTLVRASGLGSPESFVAVTDTTGRAVLSVVHLDREAEYHAVAGSVDSNRVAVAPVLP